MARFLRKSAPVEVEISRDFRVLDTSIGAVSQVPGDFLVTENGETLPVRSYNFRRQFEPADAQACAMLGFSCSRCDGRRCPNGPGGADAA